MKKKNPPIGDFEMKQKYVGEVCNQKDGREGGREG